MKVIRGRKALVTGAASGIGRALALALAAEGADLFLLDIDEARLAETAREAEGAGASVICRVCDLAHPEEISAAVAALGAAWGDLNILVNNAGITYYGPTNAMSNEMWQRLLAVNLLAPIQLTRELLPMLARQEEAHIVNLCSFLGLVPLRKMVAYQTSKFGLVGFSMTLRAEYGSETLGITAVCPGFVRTPALLSYGTADAAQQRHELPAWVTTTPDNVAAKTLKAIRRNTGLLVITPLAWLCWFAVRISPSLVDWLVREGWRRKGKAQPR